MTFFIVHCEANPKRIIMDHTLLSCPCNPHQLWKRVRCEVQKHPWNPDNTLFAIFSLNTWRVRRMQPFFHPSYQLTFHMTFSYSQVYSPMTTHSLILYQFTYLQRYLVYHHEKKKKNITSMFLNIIKQLYDSLFPRKEATIKNHWSFTNVCCKVHNTQCEDSHEQGFTNS